MKTHDQRKARLFYLVGASGSGKDSIMRRYRQEAVAENRPIVTAHRYITRENISHEASVCLSESEFAWRDRNGLFSMSWHANGLCYGIGNEIEGWLAAGFSVLINGSRAYLPQAKTKFGDQLHSILIDVPTEVLASRLENRGREGAIDIEQRLRRHQELSERIRCDSIILNNDEIDVAVLALKEVIESATAKNERMK